MSSAVEKAGVLVDSFHTNLYFTVGDIFWTSVGRAFKNYVVYKTTFVSISFFAMCRRHVPGARFVIGINKPCAFLTFICLFDNSILIRTQYKGSVARCLVFLLVIYCNSVGLINFLDLCPVIPRSRINAVCGSIPRVMHRRSRCD